MNDQQLLAHARLQFNITNPTFEDCYLDGYECAQNEVEDSYNPYPESSREHELWAEGWQAGFYNETPLFSLDGSVNNVSISQAELINIVQFQEAANQDKIVSHTNGKVWLKRTAQVAAAIFVTLAAIELMEAA